jgi:hypothetical protein
VSATTATVLSQVTASAAVEIFKDGSGNGSTAITGTMQTGPQALCVGAHISGDQPMNGRLYGVIQRASAFSAAERASVEAYLTGKM